MSRDLRTRLEKLEARRTKKAPFVWHEFGPDIPGLVMHLGLWPDEQIPQEAELVDGLGWCLLDEETRREFQEEGRWDPAPNVPRIPLAMLGRHPRHPFKKVAP